MRSTSLRLVAARTNLRPSRRPRRRRPRLPLQVFEAPKQQPDDRARSGVNRERALPLGLRGRSLSAVAPHRVLIDWDWAATGIWSVTSPEELSAPAPPRRWMNGRPRQDRHQAWRGLLSDDLISALQAWNDHGEAVMGSTAHQHTQEERVKFWTQGRELAAQVQEQLGLNYEVACRTPPTYRA
jgi:hypothetical protein